MSIGPDGTVLASYSIVDEEGTVEQEPIIFPNVVELSIFEHDSTPGEKYVGLILTVEVADGDNERFPVVFDPVLAEAVAHDMLKVVNIINGDAAHD